MSQSTLWTPSNPKNSLLAQFSKKYEFGSTYKEIHKHSVENSQKFWKACMEFLPIRYTGTLERIFVPNPTGEFIGGQWFPDTKINFAENLLSNLARTPIVGLDESGRRVEYEQERLLQEVHSLQTYLKKNGLKAGDRVAALLPNCPQAIVAMLAATSLGAVWSSCSPDFGVKGVLDRFGQIDPKFLFVADGCFYNGKQFDLAEKNKKITEALEGTVIEVGFIEPDKTFEKILQDQVDGELTFTPMNFSDPVYILYSSGTTGVPKSIVHSIGGTLLQHAKEHLLHCDIRPEEKIFYYTTCGWMMWNWLVSCLLAKATVYCFEGSPTYPRIDSLWTWAKEEGLDLFGTSAKFIGACRSAGLDLSKSPPLESTRLLCSTGSPLLPEDFDYFYEKIDPRHQTQVASICGGTDIVSCFMLGNPLKPVKRGEIQAAGLGMDVAAFDDQGKRVIGKKGELVCCKPFPSMPIYFLNDPENRRFNKAYFEDYPGVWRHGDFISIDEEGGIVVYGRSDSTLNPGGVRIGSAEIYHHVESHPKVLDSLVVGQKWKGDERVLLFVKLAKGEDLTEELIRELKGKIRQGATPRHVPALIIQVREIPYTLSGKKVEIAVKEILHFEEPKNLSALAEPKVLDEYRQIRTDLQN